MSELVVLALEQMVQRLCLHGPILSGAIGVKPTLDDCLAAFDGLQSGLEVGRFLAVGMAQAMVARGEVENALSRGAVLGARFLDDRVQDFAIAFRRDRQAMFEIPGRETAFAGVIAQLDLAVLQRLAVGGAEDRQQHAAARAIRQQLPVDIEGDGMRRGLAPFQHVEPPRIVCEMHADMVGHEVEDQAEIVFFKGLAQPLETFVAAEFGLMRV